MIIPQLTQVKGAKSSEKYMAKNYPDFYNFLISKYPQDLTFSEKIYWYTHNINDYPTCKLCGNRVKYAGPSRGYYQFCSSRCSNSSQEIIQKKQNSIIEKGISIEDSYKSRVEKSKQTLIAKYGSTENANKERIKKSKQTNLERYGVETLMGSESFKEKSKQTNLERYGVENPIKSKEIQDKIKSTNLERYGVGCTFQLDSQKFKTKQTNLERYGVEYPQQNISISQKTQNSKKKKFLQNHSDILDIDYNKGYTIYICSCPHQDCNKCVDKQYICNAQTYHNRRYTNVEVCTHILPEQPYHSEGTSLELFVRNILDEYNIEYQTNVRDIINPQELDIYIPSHNLAIECNGCYWHSDVNKPNNYHIDKYQKCVDNNIQLLTFWEDQIVSSPNIVKSIILSKLGIYNERIYARKCIIKEVPNDTTSEFLSINHLQGNTNSSIKLGLYYNNELVSIMCFGKNRISVNDKSKSNQYELYRFCNKLNTQVIGGASKLLSYFIQYYNPSKITSFASNDISDGKLYEILGFVKISNSSSYWYIDPKTLKRYHRYKFRKSELIKLGYDKNLTEKQIMDSLKYLRIFDCGQTKFLLNIKES